MVVAGAFLGGALFSLYRLEQTYPSPVETALGELERSQLSLEQLDGGNPDGLRRRLLLRIDGLVLVLDALAGGNSDERVAWLLSRVARHREIYGATGTGGLRPDPAVDRKVAAVLARYRDGPR